VRFEIKRRTASGIQVFLEVLKKASFEFSN
jgi:hypothetical protein